MTVVSREAMLVVIMIAMLALGAFWSGSHMLDRQAAAAAAASDLQQSEQLADAITELRQQPAVAATEAIGERELGERIFNAARQAGVAEASLESILPQAESRLADSPYLQKPTVLSLRDIRLPQLAMFLYHLTHEADLSVSDLRLRAPRTGGNDELWEAEATLTYLIYSPATSNRNTP